MFNDYLEDKWTDLDDIFKKSGVVPGPVLLILLEFGEEGEAMG